MMVGYQEGQHTLTQSDVALAGAASGLFTRAIVQPLDVIKIRMQLQVEPLKQCSASKYHSILQTSRCILMEEGTGALWKGHVPAQVLSVLYGITQFVAFETLTKAAVQYLPERFSTELRPGTHFLCGAGAGCVSSLVCQPFDVIRTRLVAQGEPKIYHGMRRGAIHIVEAEGVRALYKGLLPTLIAIGPQSGFQFGLYALLTDLWKLAVSKTQATTNTGPLESIVCGSIAGIGAKVAVYPLDLAKKRLQVQGFEHARRSFGRTEVYYGWVHCIRRVWEVEGMTALYKGLSASLLKAAVSSACIFTFYEQFSSILLLIHR